MYQQESIGDSSQVTALPAALIEHHSPRPPVKQQLPQWIIDSKLGNGLVDEKRCHEHVGRRQTNHRDSSESITSPSSKGSLFWKLKASVRLSFRRSPPTLYQDEPKTYNNNNNKKSKLGDCLERDIASQNEKQDYTPNQDLDSGYAWVILAVMFLINASTFGTARAYGLIFEKLARQEEESRSLAALPFTIMGAVENMAGPITGYLLARTSSWRLTVFIGSCLITMAHLLAALFDSLVGQTVTMGLMCGVGLSFVTISSFQINNAYFVRYRSRAFGLGLTGAAFGTFYISPLCQYVLNNYSTNFCYLVLGLILLPNVPLSLLLRPIKRPTTMKEIPPSPWSLEKQKEATCGAVVTPETISGRLADQHRQMELAKTRGLWQNILLVIKSPVFHLIWPTQLLFCWFNFVFGMVIVDFGVDRGLGCDQALIPIWALGQLVGRLGLGSLVDMKFISFRMFTVICFAAISLATWSLNRIHSDDYEQLILSVLVFILSMFISNLYILFNDLVEFHMDKSLASLSIGISSFTGSFFLLPRASIIGYYRDTIGNYDDMFNMFSYISMAAALTWLIAPDLCHRARSIWLKSKYRHHSQSNLNLPPPLTQTVANKHY